MNASSFAVWGVFFSLLLLAALARYIFKTWLAPGAFFAIYWCVASMLPFFILPDDEISVTAVLWILVSVVAVLFGHILGHMIRFHKRQKRQTWFPLHSHIRFFMVTIGVSMILGLGAVLTTLRDASFSFRSLFSLSELVAMANWFSLGRYHETYSPSLISQALLIFVFAGPIFGGILAVVRPHRKYRLFSLLSLLPALMIMIVKTQRGAIVLAVVLWLSAYLAANCFFGRLVLFTKPRILVGILTAPLAFFAFILAALARAGQTDLSLLPFLTRKVISGAAGYMSVFSQWLEKDGLQSSVPFLGQITFAGISNALGYYERQLGLFQEFVQLNSGFNSNIYTVFRPLIQDFTVIGALTFLFALGFVFGIIYKSVLLGRIRALPLLIAFYASVLFSPYSSIWIWTSMTLTFIICLAIFWFLPHLSLIKAKRLDGRITVLNAFEQ